MWAEVHHSGQLSNKLKQELLEEGIVVRPVQVSRAMTTFSSRFAQICRFLNFDF